MGQHSSKHRNDRNEGPQSELQDLLSQEEAPGIVDPVDCQLPGVDKNKERKDLSNIDQNKDQGSNEEQGGQEQQRELTPEKQRVVPVGDQKQATEITFGNDEKATGAKSKIEQGLDDSVAKQGEQAMGVTPDPNGNSDNVVQDNVDQNPESSAKTENETKADNGSSGSEAELEPNDGSGNDATNNESVVEVKDTSEDQKDESEESSTATDVKPNVDTEDQGSNSELQQPTGNKPNGNNGQPKEGAEKDGEVIEAEIVDPEEQPLAPIAEQPKQNNSEKDQVPKEFDVVGNGSNGSDNGVKDGPGRTTENEGADVGIKVGTDQDVSQENEVTAEIVDLTQNTTIQVSESVYIDLVTEGENGPYMRLVNEELGIQQVSYFSDKIVADLSGETKEIGDLQQLYNNLKSAVEGGSIDEASFNAACDGFIQRSEHIESTTEGKELGGIHALMDQRNRKFRPNVEDRVVLDYENLELSTNSLLTGEFSMVIKDTQMEKGKWDELRISRDENGVFRVEFAADTRTAGRENKATASFVLNNSENLSLDKVNEQAMQLHELIVAHQNESISGGSSKDKVGLRRCRVLEELMRPGNGYTLEGLSNISMVGQWTGIDFSNATLTNVHFGDGLHLAGSVSDNGRLNLKNCSSGKGTVLNIEGKVNIQGGNYDYRTRIMSMKGWTVSADRFTCDCKAVTDFTGTKFAYGSQAELLAACAGIGRPGFMSFSKKPGYNDREGIKFDSAAIATLSREENPIFHKLRKPVSDKTMRRFVAKDCPRETGVDLLNRYEDNPILPTQRIDMNVQGNQIHGSNMGLQIQHANGEQAIGLYTYNGSNTGLNKYWKGGVVLVEYQKKDGKFVPISEQQNLDPRTPTEALRFLDAKLDLSNEKALEEALAQVRHAAQQEQRRETPEGANPNPTVRHGEVIETLVANEGEVDEPVA